MKTPFEATVDILVAKMENAAPATHKGGAQALAEFAQITYEKMKELYEDEQGNTKS